MRKTLGFALFMLSLSLVFAVAKPSLDGRVVVADKGSLPQGLFAKTVGYLPGDSIAVTNPTNGRTVDVLVLGALDASEGVAILLSPEAAQRLDVRKDASIQVKLTKRTGQLDEPVSGTAVVSGGISAREAFVDVPPSVAKSDAEKKAAEPPADAADKKALAEALLALFGEQGKSGGETAPASEVAAPETEDASTVIIPEEIVMLADDADVSSSGKEEPLVIPEERVAVSEAAQPVYIDDSEPDSADRSKGKAVLAEKLIVKGPSSLVDDARAESYALSDTAVLIDDSDAPALAKQSLPAEKAAAREPSADGKSIREEAAPLAAEDNGCDRTPAASALPSDESSVYKPIVLVPADSNPPEGDGYTVPSETAVRETSVPPAPEREERGVSAAGTPVPVKEERVASAAALPEPVTEYALSPAEEHNEFDKYIVPEGLKGLESGKYYIQIATLGNKDNVKNLVAKYGSNYPIALVPNSSGTAYQVMIGALTVDEYGIVLERFRKSYGFADAFLRKIR